jgi:hypothetical protein
MCRLLIDLSVNLSVTKSRWVRGCTVGESLAWQARGDDALDRLVLHALIAKMGGNAVCDQFDARRSIRNTLSAPKTLPTTTST